MRVLRFGAMIERLSYDGSAVERGDMAQQETGRRPLPSQERRETPTVPVAPRRDSRWVTLREAHEETGIPISTLRSWSRKGRVSSQLDLTEAGPRRMVSLGEVLDRARSLGRLEAEPEVADTPVQVPPETPPDVPPDGAMLVPIDAWNRMLNQLGNLHEAGQQLAEARERAARAETEAAFLRERIGDMRQELHRLQQSPREPEHDPRVANDEPRPSGRWRLLLPRRRRRLPWRRH